MSEETGKMTTVVRYAGREPSGGENHDTTVVVVSYSIIIVVAAISR